MEDHSSSVARPDARDAKTSVEGSGHTPGPWLLRRSSDGSGDIGVTASGLGNVLAECYAAMRHYNERALAEVEANARLIAAAPDLLEALRAALPQLEALADDASNDLGACVQEGGKPTEPELATVRFLTGLATAAQAAIAKATSPADTASPTAATDRTS